VSCVLVVRLVLRRDGVSSGGLSGRGCLLVVTCLGSSAGCKAGNVGCDFHEDDG
jgi:hypothetical protein